MERRIKTVGLCLIAVFALSAIIASAAQAKVEQGQCVKTEKKGTGFKGHFTNKSCTQEESAEIIGKGGKTNKYEWEPGAGHNGEYTTKGTTAELNTGETKVKCGKKTIGKGKITGSLTSEAKFSFTGCELVGGNKIKCQTHGAEPGEIETGKLEGTLSEHGAEIWISYASKNPELKWAAFECIQTGSFELSGHLAGVWTTPPNAMSKRAGMSFAEGTGEQDLVEEYFNNRTLEEEEESLTLINTQSIKYTTNSYETRTEVKPPE